MLKIIHHPLYASDLHPGAPESAARARVIYDRLHVHFETAVPSPATKEDLLRVHVPRHYYHVWAEGKEIREAAFMAAGGAILAGRLAMEGTPAFALTRPPGHHAGTNGFKGYCYFNNMAVAAASLLEAGLARDVLIVDFDMHHADGTQDIFQSESRVTIIDPEPAESGLYLANLARALEKIERADVIAVCAGFDLHRDDWGGMLETRDYHEIGRLIAGAADRLAGGHRFAVLEGGYSIRNLGLCALAFCEGFHGEALDL